MPRLKFIVVFFLFFFEVVIKLVHGVMLKIPSLVL